MRWLTLRIWEAELTDDNSTETNPENTDWQKLCPVRLESFWSFYLFAQILFKPVALQRMPNP